ncbi:MAG: hypothetical protein N838_11210 [Thiohalocapsa sp. PB-PSB1]|nr:MAG: hypothetical protein N838_11210 [Thiohalocapsa sp. PB-PSB1]
MKFYLPIPLPNQLDNIAERFTRFSLRFVLVNGFSRFRAKLAFLQHNNLRCQIVA